MEKGESELAAQHFEAAVKYSPDLASPHYNLALMLQRHNQLASAEHEYRAALALSSDQTEIVQSHNNLGILYLAEQKFPHALAELNAAIALDPNQQNSYIGRGTIELQTGGVDSAVADFSRAASLGPSPIALYWLGMAYERQGKSQLAFEAYEVALKYAPGMVDARACLEALRRKAE